MLFFLLALPDLCFNLLDFCLRFCPGAMTQFFRIFPGLLYQALPPGVFGCQCVIDLLQFFFPFPASIPPGKSWSHPLLWTAGTDRTAAV